VPLARTVISRSWAGEGEGRSRLASTAGEDDVIPRAYRDGDELRRVHWRSTARYGTLMVRREEQRWRNRATVLLDTRTSAHLGNGAASSFEAAVSTAASVGVHIAQEGLTGQFLTETQVIRGGPFFEDSLLDALAVIRTTTSKTLTTALKELRASGAGVIIAVMGRLTTAEAQQLAACRTEGSQGIAVLLAVSSWAQQHPPPQAGDSGAAQAQPEASGPPADDAGPRREAVARASAETAAAATVLRQAGWHVTSLDAGTPLGVAWQRLPRTAEMLVQATASVYTGPETGWTP
jgi:uncharacterized protein (DUF58 family)